MEWLVIALLKSFVRAASAVAEFVRIRGVPPTPNSDEFGYNSRLSIKQLVMKQAINKDRQTDLSLWRWALGGFCLPLLLASTFLGCHSATPDQPEEQPPTAPWFEDITK